MSKINQIENRIRELDGGAFQKLADGYLRKKGYERLNPIGSVIGVNKTRTGTPDTLIPIANGKYVLCEYTTEHKGLFRKLKTDLDKCFDSKKTGIPVKKIEEIVVCHSSVLNPDEEHKLREMCRKRRVNLNLFGLGPLSYDLYEHYPKLALDHLGIEVDTGQVVSLEDFVTAYNKGAFATPLDTKFFFREEETGEVLRALEEGDLVIVRGRPGVGKTRHALECCAKFAKIHPEYVVRCVFHRGPDLFQDLQFHFATPKHHLILVDDANRVNRFEYALQLLHKQDADRRVKIVATVRDYVVESIREISRPYGGGKEIALEPFTDDQITRIVADQFEIRNQHFLDRIAQVSRGIPRIAIMAAQVAKRENTLFALRDLSLLYDEYYRSVRQDFQDIEKRELLKAAGIVAFFGAIDKSNTELMDTIRTAFSVTPEAFWDAVRLLHAREVVDLYEDEVVRVSDQVLATYLFYLAGFKERVFSFSAILTHFFPRSSYRITEALRPIVTVFDFEVIKDVLRPHVDEAWSRLEASGDEDGLLQLMHLFWPLKETEILIFVRHRVNQMAPEDLDVDKIEIKQNSDIPRVSLLSLLSDFRGSRMDVTKLVLSTLFDLLSKRPRELPRVLHILDKSFGFKHTSDLQRFTVQRSVIDMLWERTRDGRDPLFVKLFLAVAESYLQTNFHDSETREGNALALYTFDIPACPPIIELRKLIWAKVFEIYKVVSYRGAVLNVVEQYHPYGQAESVIDVISADAAEVKAFFSRELDPAIFRHCRLVHGFLTTLNLHGIKDDRALRRRFRSEAFNLYEIFARSKNERREMMLEFDKSEKINKNRLVAVFRNLDRSAFRRVFFLCREILDDLAHDRKAYAFLGGLVQALLHLADRSPSLFSAVMQDYLDDGNQLKLCSGNAWRLAGKLVQVCGRENSETIIRPPDYAFKASWLFGFYVALAPEDVTDGHIDEICNLYKIAEAVEIPYQFDFLIKFLNVDGGTVARVVQTVLQRAEQNLQFAHVLSGIFNPFTEINKEIDQIFKNNLQMLKSAYIKMIEVDPDGDSSAISLSKILDLDQTFIADYLESVYRREMRPGIYNRHVDYSLLWKRQDFEEVLYLVAHFIFQRERGAGGGDYFSAFFINSNQVQPDPLVLERQDRLLGKLIEQHWSDKDFALFLFSCIASFGHDRRLRFIKKFLSLNKRFEDFRTLPLQPSTWTWSGSLVPMHRDTLAYFESLLPILDSADFIFHRHYIEQLIGSIRRAIEQETKRDFARLF